MKLQEIFNQWAESRSDDYSQKQWLLSKWEMCEGIEWSQEKNNLIIQSILRNLKLKSNDLFLDVGCGGGWILKMLESQVKSSVGLDFSIPMLKFARQVVSPDILLCAQANCIPFKDGVFHKVLCYYVFINFSDDQYIEESFLEIWRILKKGGVALVGQLPDTDKSAEYDSAKSKYIEYYKKRQDLGKNTSDIHVPPLKLYSKTSLKTFFQKHNIKFSYTDSFNPFYYPGQPRFIDWRFDIILEK